MPQREERVRSLTRKMKPGPTVRLELLPVVSDDMGRRDTAWHVVYPSGLVGGLADSVHIDLWRMYRHQVHTNRVVHGAVEKAAKALAALGKEGHDATD